MFEHREKKMRDLLREYIPDAHAFAFVDGWLTSAQMFDDIVDGDRPLSADLCLKNALRLMTIVYHEMPMNAFYQKHAYVLSSAIRLYLHDWYLATTAEHEAAEINVEVDGAPDERIFARLRMSYEKRNSFFDLAGLVVDLLYGQETMKEFMSVWVPLTRESQDFESYIEKVLATERPAKEKYRMDGGGLIRHDLFSTLLFESQTALDLAYMVDFVKVLEQEDPDGIERSNVLASGAWHSSNGRLHGESAFEPLCAEIYRNMWLIAEQLDYMKGIPFKISGMWANSLDKGGFNRNHIHPNSLWSGVFYLQCEKGSGRIGFSDPRPQTGCLQAVVANAKKLRPEMKPVHKIEPEEGKMILFPGYLPHEVEPNSGEKKRISIAFNVSQLLE